MLGATYWPPPVSGGMPPDDSCARTARGTAVWPPSAVTAEDGPGTGLQQFILACHPASLCVYVVQDGAPRMTAKRGVMDQQAVHPGHHAAIPHAAHNKSCQLSKTPERKPYAASR